MQAAGGMKQGILITAFVLALIAPARGDDDAVVAHFQFKSGSPITLRLTYRGGIDSWDGGVSVENGTLVLTNAMFISVSNSANERVVPKKGKVLSVWADAYFRDPFDIVIDISEFYNLTQPSKYTVRWGCRDVITESVFIEIVD